MRFITDLHVPQFSWFNVGLDTTFIHRALYNKLYRDVLQYRTSLSDISCLKIQPGKFPVRYTQLSSGQANCSYRTAIISIVQKNSQTQYSGRTYSAVSSCTSSLQLYVTRTILQLPTKFSLSRQHKTTFICSSLAY